MFTTSKVAQMAALFAAKQGGAINVLKLNKLLYLADRESMSRHGCPISFDRLASMPHGPVLSQSLNLISGLSDSAKWDEWITDCDNYDVGLTHKFVRDDLDQLSDADIEVIDEVWKQFGHMTKYALRDYTHENCPEWKDPDGSSIPIKHFDVLVHLGKSKAEARELADCIESEGKLDRLFARM
ncbi:MAG: Panacea domain-containing protein [Gammaproteobacteria bacterium]